MRICIIAEGNYPYVLGGVSSWIDSLTRACPEHEFVIYAICPDLRSRGKYKYRPAENITKIIDVFLDEIQLVGGVKGKRYNLGRDKEMALKGLLLGEGFSWDSVFEIFRESRFKHVTDFFMSKDFYDLVTELYINKYPYTPFTEFIWTIRSMYLVLFHLLMQKMPAADLYHSVSTGYAGILASYGKFLSNKPFILTEHGIYTREREEEIIKADWVKGYYKELWIKYFYHLSRCAYNSADQVISLFEKNKELQVDLGCPEDKIMIIPNGIDTSRFRDIPGKDDDGYLNIGAIVRVAPIKDIHTMLLSFNIVKNEFPKARFYIMGPTEEDPQYYQECLELVKQLALEDVIFTGAIKIFDYIGKMDILVLTSVSEGQPLAIMEGMAARKPHVCTNVGHCSGLMLGDENDHYGQAGFIEHVMDYNGIAQSLLRLARNEVLRYEMGDNAFQRVNNLYKKEDFIAKYKDLYLQYGRV